MTDETPTPASEDTAEQAQAPPESPPVPGMTWDGTHWVADSTDDTTRAERRRPRSDERYREQLRTVEQQRDRLQAQEDSHDRDRAERDVKGILLEPSDMWFEASVDDCRDEDGNYSPDLAIEAARRCAKAHRNWTASPAAPASLVGWAATKPEIGNGGTSFVDAFRPKRR